MTKQDDTDFEALDNQLPTEVPLLLIRGAIIMPKIHFPLPIFDPIHLAMICESMRTHEFIGIVQPSDSPVETPFEESTVKLFSTGSLARIVELTEVGKGKYVVILEGICRFTLLEKHVCDHGYPLGKVSYDRYTSDFVDENDFSMDRTRLLKALKIYFLKHEMSVNWDDVRQTSNQKLISILTMVCPFYPSEKQALLETENMKQQSDLVLQLIEMSGVPASSQTVTYH